MSSPKKRKFEYRPPTAEALMKRATQKTGGFDRIFKEGFETGKTVEGRNTLRIMYATWPGAETYCLEIWSHSNIGPDRQRYLCPRKMGKGNCPICEEYEEAQRNKDEAAIKELRPWRQMLVWAIDRKAEKPCPTLFTIGVKIDKDLAAQAVDPDSGELLHIDDPDHGYDISFLRTGTKKNTDYSGAAISRRSTPLSDDPKQQEEWLDYIADNPLPSVLNIQTYEYLERVFHGKAAEKEDSEPEPATTRSERASRAHLPDLDPGDDFPAIGARKTSTVVAAVEEEAPRVVRRTVTTQEEVQAPASNKVDSEFEEFKKWKASQEAAQRDDIPFQGSPAPQAGRRPLPRQEEEEAPVARPRPRAVVVDDPGAELDERPVTRTTPSIRDVARAALDKNR